MARPPPFDLTGLRTSCRVMGLGSRSIATVSRGVGLGASTGASYSVGSKAGSSRIGSKTPSVGLDPAADGLLFLGLLLGAGLALGVVCTGLRRSPGLSSRDPKEGVAGPGEGSFFTTFLDSVLDLGEQLLLLSDLEGFVLSHLSGVRVLLLSSLSSRQSNGFKEAVGGCKAWPC